MFTSTESKGCTALRQAVLGLVLFYGLWPFYGAQAKSHFAPTLSIDSMVLQRCGIATLKAYHLFTVGHSALYRPNCAADWRLATEEPRYIEFRYQKEIPATAFRESAVAMLQRNLKLSEQDQQQLEHFHLAYQDVVAGDVYAISYQPDHGLELFLNGNFLSQLKHPALAKNYFAIWLGDHPFDDDLKKNLLGNL